MGLPGCLFVCLLILLLVCFLFKNLKTVPKTCNTNNYMTVGVVNVRSIKNKTVDFVDNIINDNYDLCMVTEMWLTNSDSLVVNEATPSGYYFDHVQRSDRAGGGIGIVCKSSVKPKEISAGQKKTYEVSEWILRSITDIFNVAVIYRPPYCEQNKVSITDFTAEFSSCLENIITTPHKLVIGGDFNIHVEDTGNSETNK